MPKSHRFYLHFIYNIYRFNCTLAKAHATMSQGHNHETWKCSQPRAGEHQFELKALTHSFQVKRSILDQLPCEHVSIGIMLAALPVWKQECITGLQNKAFLRTSLFLLPPLFFYSLPNKCTQAGFQRPVAQLKLGLSNFQMSSLSSPPNSQSNQI